MLLDLVFPPHCLHCEEKVAQGQHFCSGCAGFFELIDPEVRCSYCFEETGSKDPCYDCRQNSIWGMRVGAALDYLGAVRTLVKKLKYGQMFFLAKFGASFMLAQLLHLKWPMPDVIIPVPRRHWFQGMNHAELLAKQLALLLNMPYALWIKRRGGDYSQSRLSKQQRERFPTTGFYLKKNAAVEDKIVLLVDDVITTGTTLRRCASTLSQSFPAKIYALALASAHFSQGQ